MARMMAMITAAALAWFIGAALNVPVWRDWEIGDRFDMASCAAALVFFLTARSRETP